MHVQAVFVAAHELVIVGIGTMYSEIEKSVLNVKDHVALNAHA